MDIKIGENIKFYRLKAGLTQEEVAKLCDKEPSEISNYETNRVTPSLQMIMKLALSLNISIHSLTSNNNRAFKNQLMNPNIYKDLSNLNEKELNKIINQLIHLIDNQNI